jgi:hypothetical protein
MKDHLALAREALGKQEMDKFNFHFEKAERALEMLGEALHDAQRAHDFLG